MKRIACFTLLALVLLVLPTIAWAQAAPAPDTAPEAAVAPSVVEAAPAVEETATPGTPLTRTGLAQDPVDAEVIYCDNPFICRQICLDNCAADFNECTSGCSSFACQRDCMWIQQQCADWCWITF